MEIFQNGRRIDVMLPDALIGWVGHEAILNAAAIAMDEKKRIWKNKKIFVFISLNILC